MSACSCQQFELYASESTVNGGRTIPPAELQDFVDQLRDLPYWERNFANVLRVDCFVRSGNGKGSVGAWRPERNAGQIEMAPVHLIELYVLHELSHVLAEARYGSRSHDPWFARTYLELVYAAMGPDTYAALRESFERGGVDHDTDNSVPAGRQV